MLYSGLAVISTSHKIQGNQYIKEINSLFLEMEQDPGLSQMVDPIFR